MKLSIIVPVFNEVNTLQCLLNKVVEQKFIHVDVDKEILIVVDSRSNDGSLQIAEDFVDSHDNISLHIADQRGKGYAMKIGYKHATGSILLIQDADLEYDPGDYEELITPIIDGKTKFVLGVRFLNERNSTWHIRNIKGERFYGLTLNIGGILINWLMNVLYSARLYDQATMYKVIHKDILDMIKLESNMFELEVEMICKLLRKGIHPLQLPVSYNARSNKEGKKIRFFRDGWSYIRVILKYRFYKINEL